MKIPPLDTNFQGIMHAINSNRKVFPAEELEQLEKQMLLLPLVGGFGVGSKDVPNSMYYLLMVHPMQRQKNWRNYLP